MQSFFHEENQADNKPFNVDDHFELTEEGVKLRPNGIELMISYDHRKYQSNITLIKDKDPLNYFLKMLPGYLDNLKKHKGEYRAAILLGATGHTTLIFVLKNKYVTGFVVADSKGDSSQFADLLEEKTGLPAYYIEQPRQHDHCSCYGEGEEMGKELTRKKEGTDEYFHEDVFTEFIERSEENGETYLPDFLLKVVQLQSFMDRHDAGTNKVIHNNEKLNDLRLRYTDDKGYPAYMYEKGFKMVRAIIIEYYLQQAKAMMGKNWDDKFADEFIKRAKTYAKSNELKTLDRIKPFAKNIEELKEKFVAEKRRSDEISVRTRQDEAKSRRKQ